jgi:CRISPR-associated protein Cas5d
MAADLSVHVSGPVACFTRPEFAAERVSYPMITPTAAVGLLSAIFWKPEFDWRVSEIWVLNPIKWLSITRNEVSARASSRQEGIVASEARVQRHSLCLSDVAYVIFARPVLRAHATDPVAKYRDQFRRRVERGACFARPYLGLQEFHADFGSFDPDRHQPDRDLTLPIGSMPLDLRFKADTDEIDPLFFPAKVTEGRLAVPSVEEVAGAPS